MKISGLGIPPIKFTASGLPQSDTPVIKILAGEPSKGKYGLAYDHFKSIGQEEFGKECCEALASWVNFKQIDTLLQTFILPL